MVTLVVTFNHLLLQEFKEPFKHGSQRWNRTGPHSAPTRGFSDRLAYLVESLDPTDIARQKRASEWLMVELSRFTLTENFE